MKEYLNFFKNTFNIKDTTSRSDYWLANLDNIIVLLLFIYLSAKYDIFALVLVAYLIITIIPLITLNCRRLNDLNLPKPLIFVNLTVIGIICYTIIMFLPSKIKKEDEANKIYYDFDNISKENTYMNYDMYNQIQNDNSYTSKEDSNFFE